MGIVITVVIILFVIGSVSALRPSPFSIRQDKFLMLAKQLEFLPTLVACPSWLRGKDNEFGKGMIAKYSLVLEDMKLPYACYHVIDGQWRPITINGDNQPTDFSLDKQPLDLPTNVQPFVKGLEARANGICLYWSDDEYLHPQYNPNYRNKDNESNLLAMKNKLLQWANEINTTRNTV